ncbi:MAG: hypothetical protein ACD_48C00317G0001, partial [uncultured bacterium]
YVDDSTDQDGTMKKKFFEKYKEFCDTTFGRDGVRASDVSLREQAWAFQFAEEHPDAWEAVTPLKQEYQRRFVRLFIACEQDAGIAQRLVHFLKDSSVEKRIKEELLDAYSNITDELDRVDQSVAQFYRRSDTVPHVDTAHVTKHIGKRAYMLLNDTMDRCVRGEDGAKNVRKLANIRGDIVSFASIFRTIIETGGTIDFASLDIEKKDSGDLSSQELSQLRNIFRDNRLDISEEFADLRTKTEFDPVMKTSGSDICMLKIDDVVVAFARYVPLDNGNMYVGFVNTLQQIQGFKVGSTFFSETLQRQDPTKIIELKVRVENTKAVELYSRDMDFHTVGEPYTDPITKKEYLHMQRDARVQKEQE